MDITDLSAADLSEAIHRRDVSCREVMASYLDRIDERNPAVNAIVSRRDRDELLAEAATCDDELVGGHSRGWMHGMPQAIKDLLPTKGLRTTMGSRLLEDFVPTVDALIVQRMKAAGCIVIGKTNVPEFGLGLAHLQRRVRDHLQRVRPHPHCRRQQWWSGGFLGPAHASRGRRQRLHGIAAQPGRLERRVRVPPEPGTRSRRTGARQLPRATRDGRSDGTHRARRCAVARHTGGIRRRVAAVPVGETRRVRHCARRGPSHSSSTPEVLASGGSEISTDTWRWSPASSNDARAGCGRWSRIGCAVEPTKFTMAPDRVWQAWLVWRHFLVSANLLPLITDPSRRELMKPEALWEVDRGLELTGVEITKASVERTTFYSMEAGVRTP